ncbi:hypothetical protein PCE1_001148 [Barthelona sp. PCE]
MPPKKAKFSLKSEMKAAGRNIKKKKKIKKEGGTALGSSRLGPVQNLPKEREIAVKPRASFRKKNRISATGSGLRNAFRRVTTTEQSTMQEVVEESDAGNYLDMMAIRNSAGVDNVSNISLPFGRGEDQIHKASDTIDRAAPIQHNAPPAFSTLNDTGQKLFDDSANLFLLQMPSKVPFRKRKKKPKKKKKETLKEKTVKNRSYKAKYENGFHDIRPKYGLLGSVIKRKSGKVQLKMGNMYYDITPGAPHTFASVLANLDVFREKQPNIEEGEGMINTEEVQETYTTDFGQIGEVDSSLIVTPMLDMI